MKTVLCVAFACCLATLSAGAFAEEQPLMAKPGKVLFEDDFSSGKFGPMWKVGKGSWKIEEGVVRSAENPADMHGAYAKAMFPYRDIVEEFKFKFDGSKSFLVNIDDHDFKGSHAGHIARVIISPTQVQIGDSKFGAMNQAVYDKMKDPKTTGEEKKKIQAGIKDKTASFKISLDVAVWHQARLEMVGDQILFLIDGKPVAYHKSDGYAHETKNLLGFTVSGKSTLIDNMKVWEATPTSDWSAHSEKVIAEMKK